MTLIEEMQSSSIDLSAAVVQRLYKIAYVSMQALQRLAGAALQEEWGEGLHGLRKLVAIQTMWAFDNGQVYSRGGEVVLVHTSLRTEGGQYLTLEYHRNNKGDAPAYLYGFVVGGFCCAACSTMLGGAPVVREGAGEFRATEPPSSLAGCLIMYQHILQEERLPRIGEFQTLPGAAKKRLLEGAIQFGLLHELWQPMYYQGNICLAVPLFLSQENITASPDVVVVLRIRSIPEGGGWAALTTLPPCACYGSARACSSSRSMMHPWMVNAWANQHGDTQDEE